MAKLKSKTSVPKHVARVRIKKKPTAPPIKPTVFQDHHNRTFLLLEEKGNHNRYLSLRDEELQVIKLYHDLPARNDDGQLKTHDVTTSTTELHAVLLGNGEPYNIKKAAQKLFDSLLVRTPAATRELCIILGKPVPEVSAEEQQTRKAIGERLKAAREQRHTEKSEDRNTTLTNEKGNATMSTKKTSKKATTKSAVKTNGAAPADIRKITLLAKENPKRAGSDSHKRFSLYSKVKTVGDFLKAGGTASDISWDVDHKFIEVKS